MILGTGIDIVELDRIGQMAERYGDRFLRRVFTEEELAYARARAVQTPHLAGRFAAKEAVLKALGTGWVVGISWRDVMVEPTESGRPVVILRDGAAARAEKMGIGTIHITISHSERYAVASAIAESGERA